MLASVRLEPPTGFPLPDHHFPRPALYPLLRLHLCVFAGPHGFQAEGTDFSTAFEAQDQD